MGTGEKTGDVDESQELHDVVEATRTQRLRRAGFLAGFGVLCLALAWLMWWYTEGLTNVVGILLILLSVVTYGSLATGVLLLGFAVALGISAARL